jgi:hypothetical protein
MCLRTYVILVTNISGNTKEYLRTWSAGYLNFEERKICSTARDTFKIACESPLGILKLRCSARHKCGAETVTFLILHFGAKRIYYKPPLIIINWRQWKYLINVVKCFLLFSRYNLLLQVNFIFNHNHFGEKNNPYFTVRFFVLFMSHHTMCA